MGFCNHDLRQTVDCGLWLASDCLSTVTTSVRSPKLYASTSFTSVIQSNLCLQDHAMRGHPMIRGYFLRTLS